MEENNDFEELDSYVLSDYKHRLLQTIKQWILVTFEGIEDLVVEYKEDSTIVVINFKDGKYSKEEVETALNEMRNHGRK